MTHPAHPHLHKVEMAMRWVCHSIDHRFRQMSSVLYSLVLKDGKLFSESLYLLRIHCGLNSLDTDQLVLSDAS